MGPEPIASSSTHKAAVWKWVGLGALLLILSLGVAARLILRRAVPILKDRVLETVSTRADSRVELDDLNVSVVHGLEVSGGGLRIYPPDDVVAAGATQPLISIRSFTFHAGLSGLFEPVTRVDTVHVSGLEIYIPPREFRQANAKLEKHGNKIKILVAEFVCDDSRLTIGTSKPDKEPRIFQLQHIVLKDLGPGTAWPFDAVLVNAIPTGNIHAVGKFGPWNKESAGDSPVEGQYKFDHAQLDTIKGIGGVLSSIGNFRGQLNRIVVDGTTDMSNFSIDVADNPMPLKTEFHAIVDGTSGDTYLQPVKAVLGESAFTCNGAIVGIKGKGHLIAMDVDVPAARIQDFLQLAVKTTPPFITGVIQTKTSMQISPGKERVIQKLRLSGSFELREVHFTNSAVQDKVDMLTLRAQGEPEKAKPGAADIDSRIKGNFSMDNERLQFPALQYSLPGATVTLRGTYSLNGTVFDFRGKVRTKAKLSQMVASPWKSFLLKPVDPFFVKKGAGAEIPIKITGTKSEPKFGLALGDEKK
jgi:hypothetical protein